MTASAIFGERYTSKVGAVFDDGKSARAAAEQLSRDIGIRPEQIRVLEPGDKAMSSKLEPEQRGIARTLVRSHVTLGTGGLILGIVIAVILIAFDVQAFTLNPWFTLMVFGFFGAIAGLLLGGLVSLRPDHDRLIAWVKASSGSGHWFVLVHARDHEEESRARKALKAVSRKVVATL